MWFNRKRSEKRDKVQEAAIVEIEAYKDAQKEAVAIAKDATKQLNTLLINNGFTLKIYLAAGGEHKRGQNK